MNYFRFLLVLSICLVIASTTNSQIGGGETKPKFVKFKTDPPGGFILISSERYPAPDSAVEWTSLNLSAGTHSVIVKGQGKRATFDLDVDATRGEFVTVDFDDELVWLLLQKGYRSKVIPATFEKDDATEVTKPKEVAKPSNITPLDTATVDSLPQLIFDVFPAFKDTAKIKDLKGPVIIKALVSEQGEVITAKIDKSSGVKQFDQAVLEAARQRKYKPAGRNGVPVTSWLTYPVEFAPQNQTPKDSATAPVTPNFAKTPERTVLVLDDSVKVDQPPDILDMAEPIVNDSSIATDIKSPVTMKALVNVQGNVDSAKVHLSSGSPLFDQAVLDAAKRCKYKPAQLNGKPVPIWVTYVVLLKP